MKRQREQYYLGEPSELRSNHTNQQMLEYVQFLRQQIKHLGTQIDFEFQRASELIFSLYKHLYSPTQCPGEKATLLNKLSGFGVQWNLQSQFQSKAQQVAQARSQEGRSVNMGYNDTKDVENNKKSYNMRVKTKPQKYRYALQDDYDYPEKSAGKVEGSSRRGRPAARRQAQYEQKRVDQPNPYEKAPYKKRKSYIGDIEPGKEESPQREEQGRNSAKWQSEDEKDEVAGADSNKNLQLQQKSGNQGQVAGRQEIAISIDQLDNQGKANDRAPSQLVLQFARLIDAPRIMLQFSAEE